MGRFDYVKFDQESQNIQAMFKERFEVMEAVVDMMIADPRSKALTLTSLEEAYMWIGKGIRNDQIARGGAAELQEERKEERKNVSDVKITLVDDGKKEEEVPMDAIIRTAHIKVFYQFDAPQVMDYDCAQKAHDEPGFIRAEILSKEQYARELARSEK